MYASNLLPIAYVVACVSARTLFTTGYYEVTRLSTTSPIGAGNIEFLIDVTDPDPVTKTNTSCRTQWIPINGTVPADWVPGGCDDQTFRWKLTSYVDTTNFILGLQHSFIDPSLGDPPHNVATTFGHLSFNSTNLECVANRCLLRGNKTAIVPIDTAIG